MRATFFARRFATLELKGVEVFLIRFCLSEHTSRKSEATMNSTVFVFSFNSKIYVSSMVSMFRKTALEVAYVHNFLSSFVFILTFALELQSILKQPQVEVPDGSKYVQTEDERTRGASCVQNYKVWKHQKTHDSLKMNARKSVERTKVWT